MQITTIEMQSWPAYKTYISDSLDRPIRDNYLFRGHGSEHWELTSAFDRTFPQTPDARRNDVEDSLVQYFRRECMHYPQYRDMLNDEVQCRALAQHNGLPTRLLDWTESPYVAAYFAFQEHLVSEGDPWKRIAIWTLDRRAQHFWGKGCAVEVVSPGSGPNERMLRQSGWFTRAMAPFRTVEQYVMSIPNWESSGALKKIVIPASEAEHALGDLDLMGINGRGLLDDLSGAARSAYVRAVIHWMHIKG